MNEPSPVDCNQLTQALDVLTVKEIVRAAKAHSFQFSLAEKCRRATLISSIKSFPPLHQIIIAASAEKMSRGAEENIRLLKRARLTENDSASDVCPDFLQDVGDDIRNCRLARFIDHTNNDTIKQVICVVCASEVFATEAPIIELLSLKSKKLLKPASHHHTQELIMGMLLHNPSVVSREGASFGHVCTECMTDLASAKLPRFALANALWVGEVPFELSVLTLPERILIALYYPAAYIVKLYPKQKGAQYWDPSTINSGLRGNVSSYHLNTTDITAMIEGHIRPPSPAVLAALIGVTIIGPKNLPDRCLPSFLTVNRHRVHQALLFLKRENPLYRDISISLLNLDLLPTSGVPDEIMVGIRHTDDTTALDEERAGYVITDDDEHISSTCDHDESDTDEKYRPSVIPLQAHGVLDPNVSHISDEQMLAHALKNASHTVDEHYAVKHGSSFVNEYGRKDDAGALFIGEHDNPNHLLGAFPCLFPYGMGGFEVQRPHPLSYELHARWSMRYADRRFRMDIQFMFQVFGVLQKRQVCRSAVLQIKKEDFVAHQESFRHLQSADLLKASSEEKKNMPVSNPIIRSLKHHLSAIRSKVKATDESRASIRSQIWGMSVMKGPPSLWITINPTDTHDPIAQVFTGAEIDLDHFDSSCGPDASERAVRIANDPYAAARFFHFTIKTILSELFGVTPAHQSIGIHREVGIFGKVEGYIGTVESQGRGTLHLHIILWLHGSPTSKEMKDLLATESFRQRVATFISNNICAYHHELTSDAMKSIPRERAISYSRPLDPRNPHFSACESSTQRQLLHAVQIHQCSAACLKVVKGRMVCKRRAPFPLSDSSWIDSNGLWGPKRTLSSMNNWNPSILLSTRSNHDIKLITNGEETKDISFYISMYATKKQHQSSNVSALLAKAYAFHTPHERTTADLALLNKRLIQRCANSLSREQEFSAPEIVSYLNGWDDRYISHHFENIHIASIMALLKKTYPLLVSKRASQENSNENELHQTTDKEIDQVEYAVIEMEGGSLHLCDQIQDYIDRGDTLEEFSFLDYFLNTYDSQDNKQQSLKGRHCNVRVPYKPNTGRDGRCRVLRSEGHETMPRFTGEWFPRRDDPHRFPLYCATILAIFKPWRTLTDLKRNDESFAHAFHNFLTATSATVKRVIENVHYFYECSDKARERRITSDSLAETEWARTEHLDDVDVDEMEEFADDATAACQAITESDIEHAADGVFSSREELYAEVAMNIAEDSNIFAKSQLETSRDTPSPILAAAATHDQLQKCALWSNFLAGYENTDDDEDPSNCVQVDRGRVILHSGDEQIDVNVGYAEAVPDHTPKFQPPTTLNHEQRIAYNIVANHLQTGLPLLMILEGEGGTGKSQLLSIIARMFDDVGAAHKLARTATSGVAACLIGGSTLHSWAGLPPRGMPRSDKWATHPNPDMARRRIHNIKDKLLLIIDEMSMLTLDTLALLSQITSIVRSHDNRVDSTIPFGGLSVILCGDFGQFPPVGQNKKALYSKQASSTRTEVGRNLYSQFTTVVRLNQQMRIVDQGWLEILHRTREGLCTKEDIAEIRHLVLTDPSCNIPDFSSCPWRDAILITPRNSVRSRWNKLSVIKHCEYYHNVLYIIPPEETLDEEPLSMQQRLITAQMPMDQTEHLPAYVYLSLGMKVMVTCNIATTVNLANGSRGTIVDIILDPRESQLVTTNNTVHLRFPPALVVLQLDFTEFPIVPGLRQGEAPLFPITKKFKIGKPSVSVQRRQLALTPAYAFTDFKSQGQTINHVIVDLGKTVQFSLSPFNAYVALSRSKGRDTIRLLRDFEDKLFTRHPSEDLREEELRLTKLAERTKRDYYEGKYGTCEY